MREHAASGANVRADLLLLAVKESFYVEAVKAKGAAAVGCRASDDEKRR